MDESLDYAYIIANTMIIPNELISNSSKNFNQEILNVSFETVDESN